MDKDALLRDIQQKARKFINKVRDGKAVSKETYADMLDVDARITAALAEPQGERLQYEAAIAEIISDMPYFVEAKYLNLKKIKLPDGREALIQIHVTCDEHELDWHGKDWRPLPSLLKE